MMHEPTVRDPAGHPPRLDAAPDRSRESALPVVSIVVPAYNAARYLRECIDSILAQQGCQPDVIVVDDGSTDDTAAIVRRYGSSVRYIGQPHSGRASAARNHGIAAATGQFITFLDADDVMLPEKLRVQLHALQCHPGLDCVITDYRNFSESGAWPESHFETCRGLLAAFAAAGEPDFLVLTATQSRTLLTSEYFGSACSPMFRAASLRRLEGYDEGLSAAEDFELQYRFSMDAELGVSRVIGFRRRFHETNVSHMTMRVLLGDARCRMRLAALEPDEALRRQLLCAADDYITELFKQILRRSDLALLSRTLRREVGLAAFLAWAVRRSGRSLRRAWPPGRRRLARSASAPAARAAGAERQ